MGNYASAKGHDRPMNNVRYVNTGRNPGGSKLRHVCHYRKEPEDYLFIPERVYRGMDGKVLGKRPAEYRKRPVVEVRMYPRLART